MHNLYVVAYRYVTEDGVDFAAEVGPVDVWKHLPKNELGLAVIESQVGTEDFLQVEVISITIV